MTTPHFKLTDPATSQFEVLGLVALRLPPALRWVPADEH